jgi:NADP-dependent 3-hydroxy acid dehydrogenase YdfG
MNTQPSMTNKVVLVVGGAGSIGAAAARLFASLGARVAISHRDEPKEAAAAADLVTTLPGAGHAALVADVAQTTTLAALRAEIERHYGRLDVLVNAAGFTRPVPHADLDALDDELIDKMFAVNWRGQFATIRTFAPLLKASGDGLIVSISSIAGTNGIGSSIAYCAVKAVIDVMTKVPGPRARPRSPRACRGARRGRHRLRSGPWRGFQHEDRGDHPAAADRHCRRHRLGDPRLRHATRLRHRHHPGGRRRPLALKEAPCDLPATGSSSPAP